MVQLELLPKVPGNVLGGIYYETSPYGIEGAFWYLKLDTISKTSFRYKKGAL